MFELEFDFLCILVSICLYAEIGKEMAPNQKDLRAMLKIRKDEGGLWSHFG